jgi:phage/plasmid-like protein (TIGR03299 family)
MFSRGERPWHYNQTKDRTLITDRPPATIEELLTWSGTDWSVIQKPVFTVDDDNNAVQIENRWATVREDTGRVLGIGTDRYTPVQNARVAQLPMDLLRTPGFASFETGGYLGVGERVWYLVKMEQPIEVSKELGEILEPYLLTWNSHDGTGAFGSGLTTVRVVCENTYNASMADGLAKFHFRHTQGIEEQIEAARDLLFQAREDCDTFQDWMRKLIASPFGKDDMVDVLGQLYPVPPEGTDADKKRLLERRELCMQDWLGIEDLENCRFTAYGALQGMGHFVDHVRRYRNNESRMVQLMSGFGGLGPAFKAKAFNLVTAKVGFDEAPALASN